MLFHTPSLVLAAMEGGLFGFRTNCLHARAAIAANLPQRQKYCIASVWSYAGGHIDIRQT
jgi:hypothetical protein